MSLEYFRLIRSTILALSTVFLTSCVSEDTSKQMPAVKNAALAPSDCILPNLGTPIPSMAINGIAPRALDAPAITMLGLVSTRSTSEDGTAPKVGISVFPLLPNGGISVSDTCGSISAIEFSQDSIDTSTVGLRLHPLLDLAAAYPAFGAQLAEGNQLTESLPMRYAAYDKTDLSPEELVKALSTMSLLPSEKRIWELSDLLLVPLS